MVTDLVPETLGSDFYFKIWAMYEVQSVCDPKLIYHRYKPMEMFLFRGTAIVCHQPLSCQRYGKL
jgi:hypothetical protein